MEWNNNLINFSNKKWKSKKLIKFSKLESNFFFWKFIAKIFSSSKTEKKKSENSNKFKYLIHCYFQNKPI